jgi:hypothetical protein
MRIRARGRSDQRALMTCHRKLLGTQAISPVNRTNSKSPTNNVSTICSRYKLPTPRGYALSHQSTEVAIMWLFGPILCRVSAGIDQDILRLEARSDIMSRRPELSPKVSSDA